MLYLEVKGRSATTRMRIVQSLVVSDLVLGYIGHTSHIEGDEWLMTAQDCRIDRFGQELKGRVEERISL